MIQIQITTKNIPSLQKI